MPGRPISTRAEFLSLVHDTRRYACSTSGEGRTTDPVSRFSRGYFNYVCRVSACRCHCRLLSCASPFQLSGRAREISSFRYCFSTIGKRNVSQRYDIHGRKKSLRGEEEISRSLHANRLRRVAPSPFLHPPSPLRDLFSSSPSSSSSFFFFSSAFNFRGCIAVFGRDPCGFLLVIFERRCARTGEEGRKEGAGCFFGATVVRPDTFYRAVNAECGGLVRSIELFYGPRQIYRAPLSFPRPQSSLPAAGTLVSTPRSSIPTVFSARLDPANRTDLCGFNPENPSKIGDESAAIPFDAPRAPYFLSLSAYASRSTFFENVSPYSTIVSREYLENETMYIDAKSIYKNTLLKIPPFTFSTFFRARRICPKHPPVTHVSHDRRRETAFDLALDTASPRLPSGGMVVGRHR